MSNQLHQAAMQYAGQGWRVLPCREKGKIPVCKHGVKDATIDLMQIDKGWSKNPNYNVAVACGPESGVYVVDVDVNTEEGINGFESLGEFPSLPKTVAQDTPRRGAHFFFKTDNPPAGRISFRPGIDIRSIGTYCLVSPSIGENGKQYTWRKGCAPGEIELAEYPDFLRPVPKPATTPTPSAAPSQVHAKDSPSPAGADILKRASAYLATCDPAIQGQAGHGRLLWAASAMVHGFLLSDSQALDLLIREFNGRCLPPWDLSIAKDDKDFRRKVTEARKLTPLNPLGWLLNDDAYAPIQNLVSEEDVAKLIENSRAKQTVKVTGNKTDTEGKSHAKATEQQSPGKIVYPTWTAEELMDAEFPIRYLIDGMLVAGQPCILAGPKKALKTSTLIDLAISLAIPGYFLGKFKVLHAARVGIMSGESGMGVIKETYRRICKTAGADPRKLDRLVFSDRIPRLTDPAHLEATDEFIVKHKLGVLGIDPAYLALPGANAENIFVQGDRLRGITEICAKHEVTLILCHHNRKNTADPFGMPELDNIAWAGFSEWARQWILLGRQEPYTPGTGEHRLWLTVGGSVGHSSAWGLDVFEGSPEDEGGRVWETKVQDASEVQATKREFRSKAKAMIERATRAARYDRVWEYFRSHPDGATKTEVRNKTGINAERVKEAIDALVKSSSIEPCKIMVGNGRKCDGYQAIQEPEATKEKQRSLLPSEEL